MIDSLKVILKKNKLNDKNKKNFGLVTLHRPENVDDFNQLSIIIDILSKIVDSIPLVFSMHPRTYSSLKKFKLLQKIKLIENLKIYNSLGYLDFLTCMRKSKFVISDSGGVQEESSYLGIPCFTLRKNTERPITVIEGTNKIVNSKNLINKIKICERKKVKIDKWDGNTSERIIIILKKLIKDF